MTGGNRMASSRAYLAWAAWLMVGVLPGSWGWARSAEASSTVVATEVSSTVEIQTRGAVHEAFAGPVVYNPRPTVSVAKAPYALIREIPPRQRMRGANVVWIPGYWSWDDDRED